MNDPNTVALANSKAAQIGAGFNSDLWNIASDSYAMSLAEPNNRQMLQPHWAIVVPLEVGLASPENAATTLATLRERYLNEWGLKHTVGDDERVWTLPTASLSRAAYRYTEPELGFEMLRHLAQTLDYGSIGMYHELIPQGLGFMQLWSGATFVDGVIEDLIGVDVHADTHEVIISPQLPVDWDFIELNRLKFGDHTISVQATYKGVTVAHLSGPMELSVTYRAQDGTQTTRTLKSGAVLDIP